MKHFKNSSFFRLLFLTLRTRSHYCRSCRGTGPLRGAPETQQEKKWAWKTAEKHKALIWMWNKLSQQFLFLVGCLDLYLIHLYLIKRLTVKMLPAGFSITFRMTLPFLLFAFCYALTKITRNEVTLLNKQIRLASFKLWTYLVSCARVSVE